MKIPLTNFFGQVYSLILAFWENKPNDTGLQVDSRSQNNNKFNSIQFNIFPEWKKKFENFRKQKIEKKYKKSKKRVKRSKKKIMLKKG